MPMRTNHGRPIRFLAVLIVLMASMPDGFAVGPATAASRGAGNRLEDAAPIVIETRWLPNVVRVHSKVLSGGLPEGDSGFEELSRLGVQTIISVDGIRPDVQAAKRLGIRYVHLPHGYDGISPERVRELAKAVRDLPGRIYVHCHHGRHRSPAAAAAACVAAGMIPPSRAREVLHVAGTAPAYGGLHEVAENARPVDASQLDALDVRFREVAEVPPMAEAMVAMERGFDALQQALLMNATARADSDPRHEVILLREHFSELLRSEDDRMNDADFERGLRESLVIVGQLEALIAAERSIAHDPSTNAGWHASIMKSIRQLSRECKACHVRFRDNR